MPALSLTAAETAGVTAADTTLDTAFTSGMSNGDAALAGYVQSQAGGVPPTDQRPTVRSVFHHVWVALVRALATFVEPVTSVSSFSGTWGGANVGYYKDLMGIVHLQGRVSGGTLSTTAFTLPAGYKPTGFTRVFVVDSNGAFGEVVVDSNGAFGEVDVDTNGNVIPAVGSTTNVFLDGISFRP